MAEKALIGAKALDLQLRELRDGMAPKVIRASLGEALKPTLGLARAAIPEATEAHRLAKRYGGRLVAPGFSRKLTRIQTQLARDGSRASATVGPSKEAFYSVAFVEFGIPSRGIPPRPWLVPAFNATRSVMLQTLTGALRKRIARVVAKGKNR